MEMKEILNYLSGHNVLSQAEAKDALISMGKGEFSDPEIAAFLMVYLMRKITPQELTGFREALLELCVPVELDGINTIDVCGTGGDEKNTFNISTLSAFILAGAGVKVVKHGNFGVSSACGSSNIMEHYGYKFSNNRDKLLKEIETANVCYMHAPMFHPAMKFVGPVRKSLKVKTFFNILGPMINPARPKNQIVGVFNSEVQELYHQVYRQLGINYNIIYSIDGYDEISLTDNFRVISAQDDSTYSPETIGFKKQKPEDLFGGNTVEEAASIFINILENKATKAQLETVLINTAFALMTYYPKKALAESISIAQESLVSGKAMAAFKKLIEIQ